MPPFLSEALNTFVIAALNSAFAVSVEAPLLELLPPPQADSVSASAAAAAIAIFLRLVFIVSDPPHSCQELVN
jgi:hypothetical protein